MTHPAIETFLTSLTPTERREWDVRNLLADRIEDEDEVADLPPLSPGLFEKFERSCSGVLGYRPERAAA